MAEQNSQNDLGKQQVQIKVSDEDLKGKYSNSVQVLNTKEEFVIDFFSIFPPTGTMNGRIIMSPGHFKRLSKALIENLKKYEKKFGKIRDVDESKGKKIGYA